MVRFGVVVHLIDKRAFAVTLLVQHLQSLNGAFKDVVAPLAIHVIFKIARKRRDDPDL
jgi:hypothetical protein